MSSLDPFYLVKEEIQDSVRKEQARYGRWQQLPPSSNDRAELTKALVRGCDSVEWQLGELDRAIAVAERDPVKFSIDRVEIEKRRKWTSSTRSQIQSLKRTLATATGKPPTINPRQELLVPEKPQPPPPPKLLRRQDPKQNENFIQSETDKQSLILKEQDKDLEDLSASVNRLGDVGLTIHEELSGQERLVEEVGRDLDTTANRLDYVQKKLESIIKKAGARGQIVMIVFLVILLAILVMLIFYT